MQPADSTQPLFAVQRHGQWRHPDRRVPVANGVTQRRHSLSLQYATDYGRAVEGIFASDKSCERFFCVLRPKARVLRFFLQIQLHEENGSHFEMRFILQKNRMQFSFTPGSWRYFAARFMTPLSMRMAFVHDMDKFALSKQPMAELRAIVSEEHSSYLCTLQRFTLCPSLNRRQLSDKYALLRNWCIAYYSLCISHICDEYFVQC